jgi:hypothetical protein
MLCSDARQLSFKRVRVRPQFPILSHRRSLHFLNVSPPAPNRFHQLRGLLIQGCILCPEPPNLFAAPPIHTSNPHLIASFLGFGVMAIHIIRSSSNNGIILIACIHQCVRCRHVQCTILQLVKLPENKIGFFSGRKSMD